jgi:hypothetical protein
MNVIFTEKRVLGVQVGPRLDRVRTAVGSGGVVWFARRGREVERLRDDGGAGDGNIMCVFSKLLRV